MKNGLIIWYRVYTDTLISTIVDNQAIDARLITVYTDTLISTIVDYSVPKCVCRVYTDTLISTIVDCCRRYLRKILSIQTL